MKKLIILIIGLLAVSTSLFYYTKGDRFSAGDQSDVTATQLKKEGAETGFCGQFNGNESYRENFDNFIVVMCGAELQDYGYGKKTDDGDIYVLDNKEQIQWEWKQTGGIKSVYAPTLIDIDANGKKEVKIIDSGFGGSCGSAFNTETIYDPIKNIKGSYSSSESMETPKGDTNGDCRDRRHSFNISQHGTPEMKIYFNLKMAEAIDTLLEGDNCTLTEPFPKPVVYCKH